MDGDTNDQNGYHVARRGDRWAHEIERNADGEGKWLAFAHHVRLVAEAISAVDAADATQSDDRDPVRLGEAREAIAKVVSAQEEIAVVEAFAAKVRRSLEASMARLPAGPPR